MSKLNKGGTVHWDKYKLYINDFPKKNKQIKGNVGNTNWTRN